MLPRILIADPDQGFGLMLAQMLETNREYVADYVSSGGQALKLAREKSPQLVIIDAALVDMTAPALVKALRQVSPDLRIMVIPLSSSLPPEYAELNLQGTLPKPFFAGDLGECISQALAGVVNPALSAAPLQSTGQVYPLSTATTRQVVDAAPSATTHMPISTRAPTPISPSPPAPVRVQFAAPVISRRVRSVRHLPRVAQYPAAPGAQTGEPDVSRVDAALNRLSREISADAVFLIRDGTVVAQRSSMNELRQEEWADLLVGWFTIAAGMAAFVGERGGRFKQLHFEGERYHIYSFGISDASIVVAICRSDIPFGNLRLSIKNASAEIAGDLR